MARVSVLIPVFNVESYLRRCVDAVLAQTISDIEVVLIDDGSTDGSGRICDEYSVEDCRVHVVHQEYMGVSAARNAGLDYVFASSDSEFITFVDSDDWVLSNYLEELIRGLECGVDVSCVGHAFVDSQHIRYVRYPDKGWKVLAPEEYWVGGEADIPSTIWGKMYRKHLFDGIRYPVGKIMEDAFVTPCVLFQCEKIAMREVPLYNYFTGSKSIMRSEWTERKLDAVDAFEQERRYFRVNGFVRAEELAWRMTLAVMSESIPHLEKIDKAKASDFRAQILTLMANGELPFWDNRVVYRNMHVRFFAVRWLVGMIGNALTKGGRSWLAREAIPIAKLVLQKFRKSCCGANI